MTRVLYVGDPHAVVGELEECAALMRFVIEKAVASAPDIICLLGDLFHFHGVVHCEVVAFWRLWLANLAAAGTWTVVVMKGNHDGPVGADQDSPGALFCLEGLSHRVVLVSSSQRIGRLLFVSYRKDPESFVATVTEAAQGEAVDVVCHQTMLGALLGNGHPSPDGVDIRRVPHRQMISGHIHGRQTIGTLRYVGSPRWRELGDANEEKGISLWNHGPCEAVEEAFFSTAGVCRPVRRADDFPWAPASVDQEAAWVVDVHGPMAHVAKRSAELRGQGARVREYPEVERPPGLREADGVAVSLEKFSGAWVSPRGTPVARVRQLLAEATGGR